MGRYAAQCERPFSKKRMPHARSDRQTADISEGEGGQSGCATRESHHGIDPQLLVRGCLELRNHTSTQRAHIARHHGVDVPQAGRQRGDYE